ncbi:MAG: FtsX-like permease family protein [Clostridiales bacterium]|nr:FtsX-like permease family protein [Clostridiales bacterium]
MRFRSDQTTEMKQFRLHFIDDQLPTLEEVIAATMEWEIPLSSCHIQSTDPDINKIVEAVVFGKLPIVKVLGETDLTDKSSTHIAIVPHIYPGEQSELNLEKGILTLRGETLQVIGQFTGMEYLIPLEMYQQLGYSIEHIIFTLQEKPNSNMEQIIVAQLQSQFPLAQVFSPQIYDEFAERELPIELVMICLVYGLSLISFLYLLKYLMDQHLSENIVYSLIGASKKAVVRLIVLENFLLSSLSAVLSIGLHLLLKESVLDKVSISTQLTYYFSDYLLLFLLMVTVSQLVSIPFILRYCKQTAVAIRNSAYTG